MGHRRSIVEKYVTVHNMVPASALDKKETVAFSDHKILRAYGKRNKVEHVSSNPLTSDLIGTFEICPKRLAFIETFPTRT
jgi:hypothetical protein